MELIAAGHILLELLVLQYKEKLQSELRFARYRSEIKCYINYSFIRMGYALGLGALPKLILEGKLDTVTIKLL